VSAVQRELARLPGVQAVEIDLVEGGASTVTVRSDAPLDEARVREAVDEAGYQVAAAGT
jgi:copper chaperone CopZ